jgi:antitoxin component of RelBE/YafQ-DinJ toxin-antitoxin module
MRKTVNISILDVIHEKAQKDAAELGLTVSAFISMLIARYTKKGKQNEKD